MNRVNLFKLMNNTTYVSIQKYISKKKTPKKSFKFLIKVYKLLAEDKMLIILTQVVKKKKKIGS